MSHSQYLFATCQVGAENYLKDELARRPEGLRFAFSRPGFVTFKLAEPMPVDGKALDELPVFARVWGHSVGRIQNNTGDMAQLIEGAARLVAEHAPEKRLHLHVWSRPGDDHEWTGKDTDARDEGNEPTKAHRERMGIIETQLREKLGRDGFTIVDCDSKSRGWVADVVLVEPNQWWIGVHQSRLGVGSLPGGEFVVRKPPLAPSRSWRGLEEALACSGMPVVSGQVALEIGSSPGGMTMALLGRGVNVVGIDPAVMGPHPLEYVTAHPQTHFRQVQRSVFAVDRRDLPNNTDWLIVDINGMPDITLDAVEYVVALMKRPPRGYVLSFKLGSSAAVQALPRFIARAQSLGLPGVLCRQLPSNRQEITLVWHRGLSSSPQRWPAVATAPLRGNALPD